MNTEQNIFSTTALNNNNGNNTQKNWLTWLGDITKNLQSAQNNINTNSTNSTNNISKPFTMDEIIKANPLKGRLQDEHDYILVHHMTEDGTYKPAYISLKEFKEYLKGN